jgi:hypothetical protein
MILSCVQDTGQPQTGTYEQTVAFLRVPPKWGYFDQLSERLLHGIYYNNNYNNIYSTAIGLEPGGRGL